MHREYLRSLYTEYKNCIKQNFEEYFEKDDEYVNYFDKCVEQKDIDNYSQGIFNKFQKIDPLYDEELENKVDRNIEILNKQGWTAREIANL